MINKKLFDNSNLQEDIEWGNVKLPGLSDEELYKKNWNMVDAQKAVHARPDYVHPKGMKGKIRSEETRKKTGESCSKSLKGKSKTEEHKLNLSKSKLGKPLGPMSDTHKLNLSNSLKNAPKIKILCPHCNTEQTLINFKRWHGDNCKLSPNGRSVLKYKCPHCNVEAVMANFKRWHGDNCKNKKIT